MTQQYPRESKEYVFFEELRLNGADFVGAIEYSLTQGLARPLVWSAVGIQNGKRAFLLPGDNELDPGHWKVWVRVPDAPESSVIEAGTIEIT